MDGSMGLLKYSDNQQTPTKKPKNLNYIKRLVVHNIYTLYIRIEYERKFMNNAVNYKYISHLSVAYKLYASKATKLQTGERNWRRRRLKINEFNAECMLHNKSANRVTNICSCSIFNAPLEHTFLLNI